MQLRKPETARKASRTYVKVLEEDPAERDRLYERIQIKTTQFSRDPEAFHSLERNVLRPMVQNRSPLEPVRIWVARCSTGEGAYSIAMCLVECSEIGRDPVPFQILATDVSDAALRKARTGEYAHRMVKGLSTQRLRRFFVRTDGGYRIIPQIRKSCIFSRHDLVQSVPFSRMDLVTCRNVLIYMERELQRRALSNLRFALRPGGMLMLGATESIPASREWEPVDPKSRIYRASAPGRPIPRTWRNPLQCAELPRSRRAGAGIAGGP